MAGGNRALNSSFLVSQANNVTVEFAHTLNQAANDESLAISRLIIETMYVNPKFKASPFVWETGEAFRWNATKMGLTSDPEHHNLAMNEPGKRRPAPFASRSVRRALLTPQANPGSLYRCGRST